MRLKRVILLWYRSVDFLEFDVGPFTVLFGKNNVGKTNVMEGIYGVLAPKDMPGYLAGDSVPAILRGSDDALPPIGAVDVELDAGCEFDDAILSLAPDGLTGAREAVAFVGFLDDPGLLFTDSRDFMATLHEDVIASVESSHPELVDGPRPRPLFLDWEFEDIDERVTAELGALIPWSPFLFTKDSDPWGSEEETDFAGLPPGTWRVRRELLEAIQLFGESASEFLPDFVDAEIVASFSAPSTLVEAPLVHVEVRERGREPVSSPREVGRGAARWIAAAIQIALHVLKSSSAASGSEENAEDATRFSGHVLFVDEPEAHLHPSAVASIVRWCQKMVRMGFNVLVASHHEEFLRSSGDGQALVHITRDPDTFHTKALTLPTSRTTRLLELAADVGMHPAAALSIQRAILFVEGTLDEAVLDEYAGLELDAAGVKIIPIHGTRNLEGLVAVEIVVGLGIKTGVLTDDTNPSTMLQRAKRKRSSEEKKVIDVLRIAEERGLPAPAIFGVPEADLLFALPVDAIRRHVCEAFPGWEELVSECRKSLGKTPSDSVNWKAYATEKYDLHIDTPGGVRELVRKLDLANVPLPSVRSVVDQIVEWANAKAG